MATGAFCQIHLWMAGDATVDEVINFMNPAASVATVQVLKLAPGPNTFEPPFLTLPSGEPGFTVAGVLIIPPSTNTHALSLKANSLDSGINLHPTNPTLLSLANTPPQAFVIDYTGTTPIVIRVWWF